MIIFTTHIFHSFSCSHRALVIKFLDEADLLADHIAILATSEKIIASGWPVSLRRDLGEGYSVQAGQIVPRFPFPTQLSHRSILFLEPFLSRADFYLWHRNDPAQQYPVFACHGRYNDIAQNYQNLSLGGSSLDLSTGNSLMAWEATPPGLNAPALLNLASNIFYNRALNSTGNSARTLSFVRRMRRSLL